MRDLKAELDCVIHNVRGIADKCREDTRYAVPEISEALDEAITELLTALLEIGTRGKKET